MKLVELLSFLNNDQVVNIILNIDTSIENYQMSMFDLTEETEYQTV